MTMKPVQVCSICGWAYTGYGNNAQPINSRCCDQRYAAPFKLAPNPVAQKLTASRAQGRRSCARPLGSD